MEFAVKTKKAMESEEDHVEVIEAAFLQVSKNFLDLGCSLESLRSSINSNDRARCNKHIVFAALHSRKILLASVLSIFLAAAVQFAAFDYLLKHAYGTRCIVPNNYFVWEFTRPVSDCEFCRDVDSALVLPNVTREEFEAHAYTSRPVVVRGAASHWPASRVFSLKFFRDLYESVDGAYTSVEEECQFLHFKSNFGKLRDVLEMDEARAANLEGEEPWYVGWKNCHPRVLEIMNEFYDPPHFLPDDAEIPQTNYIFLGYEQGAIMHVSFNFTQRSFFFLNFYISYLPEKLHQITTLYLILVEILDRVVI